MRFNPSKLNKQIKKKGKSVSAISKEADIPLTTLYDWLNGRTVPNVAGINKLAKYLGVKMEDLV